MRWKGDWQAVQDHERARKGAAGPTLVIGGSGGKEEQQAKAYTRGGCDLKINEPKGREPCDAKWQSHSKCNSPLRSPPSGIQLLAHSFPPPLPPHFKLSMRLAPSRGSGGYLQAAEKNCGGSLVFWPVPGSRMCDRQGSLSAPLQFGLFLTL